MRTLTRLVAAIQLLLIFPAALFLTAVLVGLGDPPQYDLARIAQRVAMWYGGLGKVGLWGLLITLPFMVLISGCVTLLRSWNDEAELQHATRPSLAMIPAPVATLLVAGTTMTSAGILAVVVLHMLAN
jgi:hypothetical protein